MKILFLYIFLFASYTHAGIFGETRYEDCVDEVVKNAKFKEALYEGKINCYEKYIRPKQENIQNEAWKSNYRVANQSEVSQLICRKDGFFQNTFFIKCSFSDALMSNYAKIKLSVTLKGGGTKELELLNYAPDLKWKNEALSGYTDIEVEKIDKNSLKVVHIR